MDWNTDYDVKEYRPKKRRKIGADGRALPSPSGITRPDAPYDAATSSTVLSGAATMQTSEILDFAQGD